MFKIEYLITLSFFQSGGIVFGYCVYIEIPLKLSPASTFRAPRSDLHFPMQICEYRMNWSINLLNT